MLGDTLTRQGIAWSSSEETDLLVLNTCSVTEHAERIAGMPVRKNSAPFPTPSWP